MSTEKDNTSDISLEKYAVILLDIAGTTTSNSFVKDTLFPFVVSNVEEYLKAHWDDELVQETIKQLKEKDGENITTSEAVEIIKTATEKDENLKAVKILQGFIYKQGYENGKLKAHVFPDVRSSLENWSKNHRVAIYSSGSIESQKLLFTHTVEGDLSASIAQYFDLTVGTKTDSTSYEKIAKDLGVTLEEIVYINDNVEEATAAAQSGMKSILIIREGNAEIPEEKQKEFSVIKDFSDLSVETSTKRKMEEEDTPEEPPAKVAKTIEPEVIDNKVEEEKKVIGNKVEEEKKSLSEEEPMEIDSTNQIKVDKTGESEMESEETKDKNMEIERTNEGIEKTENETEQRESISIVSVPKSEEKVIDSEVVDAANVCKKSNINATEIKECVESKNENIVTEIQKVNESNAEIVSSADTSQNLEKLETDKKSDTLTDAPNVTDEVVSLEKETDNVPVEKNEVEGLQRETDNVPAEKNSPVADKITDESVKTDTVATAEENANTENGKIDKVSIAESVEKTEIEQKQVDESKDSEKETEENVIDTCESVLIEEEMQVCVKETVAIGKDTPNEKPIIDVQVANASITVTLTDAVNREKDPLGTETQSLNNDTENAVMEISKTTAENSDELNNVKSSEETQQKCSDVDKIESELSSVKSSEKTQQKCNDDKIESAQISNKETEIKAVQDDGDSKINTVETENNTPTEIKESNRIVSEDNNVKSTEELEGIESKCEINSVDSAENKVNGNEPGTSQCDEKENKSELANGTTSDDVENDNKNRDVEKVTEEEIRIKKIEENPDSTAVNVEV